MGRAWRSRVTWTAVRARGSRPFLGRRHVRRPRTTRLEARARGSRRLPGQGRERGARKAPPQEQPTAPQPLVAERRSETGRQLRPSHCQAWAQEAYKVLRPDEGRFPLSELFQSALPESFSQDVPSMQRSQMLKKVWLQETCRTFEFAAGTHFWTPEPLNSRQLHISGPLNR